MLEQTELEQLGFVLQGIFGTITRYQFQITREDRRRTDTYSRYFYEEDSDSSGISQRLRGGIYGGLDYRQPTYDILGTWDTVAELEVDLKKYLKKDLTN